MLFRSNNLIELHDMRLSDGAKSITIAELDSDGQKNGQESMYLTTVDRKDLFPIGYSNHYEHGALLSSKQKPSTTFFKNRYDAFAEAAYDYHTDGRVIALTSGATVIAPAETVTTPDAPIPQAKSGSSAKRRRRRENKRKRLSQPEHETLKALDPDKKKKIGDQDHVVYMWRQKSKTNPCRVQVALFRDHNAGKIIEKQETRNIYCTYDEPAQITELTEYDAVTGLKDGISCTYVTDPSSIGQDFDQAKLILAKSEKGINTVRDVLFGHRKTFVAGREQSHEPGIDYAFVAKCQKSRSAARTIQKRRETEHQEILTDFQAASPVAETPAVSQDNNLHNTL